jgi:two-component system chemotaxis response regulator CheB
VEALQTLVGALPRNLPAAMFVVLHTTAEGGHLAEILSRNGNMPAVRALNGSPITRGRIYVAHPNFHLRLENGRMWLTSGPTVNRHRPAIDPLFQSAAEAYDGEVIGVLLTGYQDDGSVGLAAVKKRGGTAIVQDPNEAYAPDMPRSAQRLVKVDHCLPLKKIAPLLVDLVEGRRRKTGNETNCK